MIRIQALGNEFPQLSVSPLRNVCPSSRSVLLLCWTPVFRPHGPTPPLPPFPLSPSCPRPRTGQPGKHTPGPDCQAPSHFSFISCQMAGIDGRHLGSLPARLVFSLLTSRSNSCLSPSPSHTPSHGCLGVTRNSGRLPCIPFLLSPRHPVILLSQISYGGAIFVCSFFSLHSFCYQIQ